MRRSPERNFLTDLGLPPEEMRHLFMRKGDKFDNLVSVPCRIRNLIDDGGEAFKICTLDMLDSESCSRGRLLVSLVVSMVCGKMPVCLVLVPIRHQRMKAEKICQPSRAALLGKVWGYVTGYTRNGPSAQRSTTSPYSGL